MIFTLPLQALSVNKAYRSGPRYKSKEYVAYEKDVLRLLVAREKIEGFVKVSYEFGMPSLLKSDLGNCEKILTDLIVKKGYITDDRWILEINMKKTKSAEPFIKVVIEKKEPSEE